MKKGILVYLLVIMAPAVILLCLGLRSVQRQHEAIRVLGESNRVLAAEKLAGVSEQRIRQLAAACLREPVPCPLARHAFTMEGGRMTKPRVQSPPPRDPPGIPAAFRDAERREFLPEQLPQALDGYRSVFESGAPASVKALALSRVARCFAKLNRKGDAAEAWQRLRDQYGGIYDPLHRPYELVARFELNQLDGVYEGLVGGRWEVSAEQFDYYLDRLNRPAPGGNQFALAREIEESFRPSALLQQGEVSSYAVPHFRIFYRVSSPEMATMPSSATTIWMAWCA